MVILALASLLGTFTGILTGLIPGIHVNTVTALLLAGSAGCASLGIEYSALLAFTCSLAISHTFFDVVPGLFLGVPGDETFALLPGHRLVKRGEGETAIRLSVAGSVVGLALGLLVVTALLTLGNVVGAAERLIRPWMFFVLAGVSIILIATDRHKSWSAVTFLASGLLGVAVLGSPLVAGGSEAPVNALFPSLAGMFGVAGLLFAIGTTNGSGTPVPENREEKSAGAGLPATRVAWSGGRGGLAGLLVGLLPGLGAANAATLLLLLEQWRGRRGTEDEQDRSYLVTTSSLNTAEALFAIAALYLIGRSRSGASIAVEQILGGSVTQRDLLQISLFMIAAGVIASWIMWRLGKRFAVGFGKVDNVGLNWSVIVFLSALAYLLLGGGGLTILIAATAVGLIPCYFKARRAQLMGFFLVPTMLFYSGHQDRIVDWLSIGQRTSPLLSSITIYKILVDVAAATLLAGAVYVLVRNARHFSRRYRTPEFPMIPGTGAGDEAWVVREAPSSLAERRLGAASWAAASVLILTLLGRAALPDLGMSVLAAEPPATSPGRIYRVIDGDTVEIASMCRRFRVRLKGVDAPERRSRAGARSRDWMVDYLDGKAMTWSAVGVDAYGRFLGYVHLQDDTLVNAEIIRQGYARANTRSQFRHLDWFRQLEREARAAGRGLWRREEASD